MKRCQKCSRTFPDETQKFCTFDGGLLMHDQPPPLDPNLTIRATSKELVPPADSHDASEAPTSTQLPNLAPTVTFGTTTFRETSTAPTGVPTSSDLVAPSMPAPTADISPPVQPAAQATSQPLAQPAAPPKKRSLVPWIIAGLLVVLLLGGGTVAVGYFFWLKPWMEARNGRTTPPPTTNENSNTNNNAANTNSATNKNTNSETKKEVIFVPPANAVKFENAKANLDGKLAEHYLDFSFYYLNSWTKDPKAGVAGAASFVKVERRLPPDLTQENVAVGWYNSKGTFGLDKNDFPRLVEQLSSSYEKNFPNYQKVAEGPTKVNSLDAYEFRFEGLSKGTAKGDIKLWGRVIFLPTGVDGEKSGVTLFMFTTSLAPEIHSAEDVGVKGELPIILDSFRFGVNH